MNDSARTCAVSYCGASLVRTVVRSLVIPMCWTCSHPSPDLMCIVCIVMIVCDIYFVLWMWNGC